MNFIIGISRIILPLLTVVIITKCMLALLLGHPKEKIYGCVIDMADGREYPLNMWETSLGRSSLCDITLGGGSVSRSHAVISRRIDGWYIFDLLSKAGVSVNGEKIEKSASIKNGDVIGLGSSSFKFEIVNDPVQAAGREKKHRHKAKPQPRNTAEEPLAGGVPRNDFTKPYEKQNTVHATGRTGDPALINPASGTVTVLRGNLVTIGRSAVSDIVLSSPMVSRRHASLVLYEDGWAVEDAGSTAGTLLNGERVTAPLLLFDGDILTLGDVTLKFSVLPRAYH